MRTKLTELRHCRSSKYEGEISRCDEYQPIKDCIWRECTEVRHYRTPKFGKIILRRTNLRRSLPYMASFKSSLLSAIWSSSLTKNGVPWVWWGRTPKNRILLNKPRTVASLVGTNLSYYDVCPLKLMTTMGKDRTAIQTYWGTHLFTGYSNK